MEMQKQGEVLAEDLRRKYVPASPPTPNLKNSSPIASPVNFNHQRMLSL
jgi:hypothetical protein